MQQNFSNESPVLIVGLSNILFMILNSHFISMQNFSISITIIVGLYGLLKQIEKDGGFHTYIQNWINFKNLFKCKK
jgi:hypothetical protein